MKTKCQNDFELFNLIADFKNNNMTQDKLIALGYGILYYLGYNDEKFPEIYVKFARKVKGDGFASYETFYNNIALNNWYVEAILNNEYSFQHYCNSILHEFSHFEQFLLINKNEEEPQILDNNTKSLLTSFNNCKPVSLEEIIELYKFFNKYVKLKGSRTSYGMPILFEEDKDYSPIELAQIIQWAGQYSKPIEDVARSMAIKKQDIFFRKLINEKDLEEDVKIWLKETQIPELIEYATEELEIRQDIYQYYEKFIDDIEVSLEKIDKNSIKNAQDLYLYQKAKEILENEKHNNQNFTK